MKDWMGHGDEALIGFSWRGGAERETTGVLLWNKPYICELQSGEEVNRPYNFKALVPNERLSFSKPEFFGMETILMCTRPILSSGM